MASFRLSSYYIFIHQYFPILPPPPDELLLYDRAIAHSQAGFEDEQDTYHPSSPLSLAIAALLALIPPGKDKHPLDPASIVLRRRYSHYLAQSAIESIEIESEDPISAFEPGQVLSQEVNQCHRNRFHPAVPLELESILALDLLSVYEYSQRGNITKMRSRAGQALVAAMELGLHSRGNTEAEFEEARRRTWWMTVCWNSHSATPAENFT